MKIYGSLCQLEKARRRGQRSPIFNDIQTLLCISLILTAKEKTTFWRLLCLNDEEAVLVAYENKKANIVHIFRSYVTCI